MNLGTLRAEVLGHGFDATQYGGRINQFINDGLNLVCTRVSFYVDEAAMDFNTVAGVSTYSQPADFARDRSFRETDIPIELGQTTLRDIDRAPVTTGAPRSYAIDGMLLHLYPTPDGVYPLELRYWKMPAPLVNDGDTPTLPVTYHRLLWYWACKECFAADDDVGMSQYWEQQFNTLLAEFAADVRFPSDDASTQVKSMWGDGSVGSRGWTRWPTDSSSF